MIKSQLVSHVNSELEYVSVLLKRFESPKMLIAIANACVSEWLKTLVAVERKKERWVGARDEDSMLIDGKNVIPWE
jgi:hypothetical protein